MRVVTFRAVSIVEHEALNTMECTPFEDVVASVIDARNVALVHYAVRVFAVFSVIGNVDADHALSERTIGHNNTTEEAAACVLGLETRTIEVLKEAVID